MASRIQIFSAFFCVGSVFLAAGEVSATEKPVAFIAGSRGWLDNGMIKIAVDRQYGGAIVYASPSDANDNMINIHDKGRQIQQSYYAGKSLDRKTEGQCPSWSPWAWNPVQAGNFEGDKSEVLKFEPLDNGKALYTQCQPRLWDMNEQLAQCHLSQRMEFEEGMDNVVRVTNTIECFRDIDDRWGPAVERSQEVPAVYTIRNLSRIVIYDGDKPWTNAALTIVKYGPRDNWIWTRQKPSEPWAACVDPKTNVGLGIYSPEGQGSTWNMGWTGKDPNGTEYSGATMHFAPIASWKLGHDTKRTFRYWIIISNLKDIRSRVYRLHEKYPNG